MEQKKLSSTSLKKAVNYFLPISVKNKIELCLNEDAAYAADELVELAEEILAQIAAVGFAHYLKSNVQKEVYNDFLLQLFTSSGHDFNAGPLYRWAANMIADRPEMHNSSRFKFFWEAKEDKVFLCSRVNKLSDLRNRVMHGFFVLPPDENKRLADEIGDLLLDLHETAFFQNEEHFHFIQNNQFTGHWNIQSHSDWELLKSDSSFGKLVSQILVERSEAFWEQELKTIQQFTADALLPNELISFVDANQRGAFACWLHPNDDKADWFYANIYKWLLQQNDTILISYTLHDEGINFTSGILLERLVKVLNVANKELSRNKKTEEHIKSLRKEMKGKIVVVVNHIHVALFSKQHVTSLNNFLFENDIILIGIGQHYEHFNSYFNQTFTLPHSTAIPDARQRTEILHNYLRFKGPYADKKEDANDVELLRTILNKLCDDLEKKETIYARRFADDNEYDMEYVHEIFALLHPWVNSLRRPFEEDTVDELYGFPTHITETTPIYLSLGRRDVKLEYKHKVISL